MYIYTISIFIYKKVEIIYFLKYLNPIIKNQRYGLVGFFAIYPLW